MAKRNIVEELKWRELLGESAPEENFKKFVEEKGAAYVGFDPSANSLHLGNYVTLSVIRRLVEAGHKVYAIVGGITGLVGDPRNPHFSKDASERALQQKEVIAQNTESLKKQLLSLAHATEVINNIDFYEGMTVWDYLRDIGKKINVNYILNKEFVASRLETGISYAEFSYTLLQGWDSYQLYLRKDVVCQFGGQDQWGNITTGLEFLRKYVGPNHKGCCFSVPLLMRADGGKFGKSEKGALWLDASKTSPFEIYQYFINSADADIVSYIKRFTFLPIDQLEDIIKKHQAEPAKRLAQKTTAYEVVKDLHGKEEADKCAEISDKLYSKDIMSIPLATLLKVLEATGSTYNMQEESKDICSVLVESGVAKSKSEARRLIEQKAIKLNNELVTSVDTVVSKEKSLDKKFSFITRKNSFTLIKW